jgi:hypothetical protein
MQLSIMPSDEPRASGAFPSMAQIISDYAPMSSVSFASTGRIRWNY